MAKIRQSVDVARYINTEPTTETPEWALLGSGAKTVGDTPAAQTKSRKYINDRSATKSVNSYDWSAPFELDQVAEQAAIDFIYNIGYKELTGSDAETQYLQVYLDKPIAESSGEYEARMRKVAIEVADNPEEDSEFGITGNFLGIGDPVFGKFNVTTKTFTEEE